MTELETRKDAIALTLEMCISECFTNEQKHRLRDIQLCFNRHRDGMFPDIVSRWENYSNQIFGIFLEMGEETITSQRQANLSNEVNQLIATMYIGKL